MSFTNFNILHFEGHYQCYKEQQFKAINGSTVPRAELLDELEASLGPIALLDGL